MATYLLSGASGFIGSALSRSLAADGHRVVRLSRGLAAPEAGRQEVVGWDPEAGRLDRDHLARVAADAVINLAGEPIAQRWTKDRQRRIRESRIRGTTALAEALASLPEKPRAFVSGSAIGYYGANRGDEMLDESSLPGSDFLAQTAGDWELAAGAARTAGIRVTLARTGIVLGKGGGVLERLLPPFNLGLGGRQGSGQQWMSWITLTDAVRGLRFLADTHVVDGAVNLVSPGPVRNTDFMSTLARVLHRPALIPVPALTLELMFGEMAHATILASQRVSPKRLAGAGFEFRHPRLEDGLRFEITRSDDRAGR